MLLSFDASGVPAALPASCIDSANVGDPITIVVRQAKSVRGRVRAGRRPVKGRVRIRGLQRSLAGVGRLDSADGVLDGEGWFQVEDLDPDIEHTLLVEPEDQHLAWRALPVPAGDGVVDVGRISLQPGATLAGWMVAGGGQPVSGAEILIKSEFFPNANGDVAVGNVGYWESRLVTDGAGSFEVRGLAEGSYRLTASAGGYEAVPPLDVYVEHGERKLIEEPLQVLDEVGSVRGVLVHHGSPAGDFIVELESPKKTLRALADENGAFVFPLVPMSPLYTLRVRDPRSLRSALEIAAWRASEYIQLDLDGGVADAEEVVPGARDHEPGQANLLAPAGESVLPAGIPMKSVPLQPIPTADRP